MSSENNKQIYIVDDDESVCRALSVLLATYGFTVDTFNSAEDYFRRPFLHPQPPRPTSSTSACYHFSLKQFSCSCFSAKAALAVIFIAIRAASFFSFSLIALSALANENMNTNNLIIFINKSSRKRSQLFIQHRRNFPTTICF